MKGAGFTKSQQAQKDQSGASNPELGDKSKSKKPEGPEETAKIKGTVDSSRPAKGHKDPEKKDSDKDE